MAELDPGLYEQLVTSRLRAAIDAIGVLLAVDEHPLNPADAADRIGWHIARQVELSLRDVSEQDRLSVGATVARELLWRLGQIVQADPEALLSEPASVLHAVLRRSPDGSPARLALPLTPVLDTTLLTNANGEPTLFRQLSSEIASADSIDLVMAFIRRSGIAPLLSPLRMHTDLGRPLRVLTTIYTDSTERSALEELLEAGAQVRVSYDVTSTRLHAKSWLFHRDSGFSTAYVGSSNLTHSAQVSGLEWNLRLSGARNPSVIDKIAAVFSSYWEGGDFAPFDADEFETARSRAGRVDTGPRVILSPVELRPEPFQERLLELVQLSRQRGHHRNLLVSATGTGKTVMAALDYATLRAELPRARLLFVAHREEILDQSLATFRYALRDPTFGEKWVGRSRPDRYEHVFASIQSLHRADLALLPPDHFDVVVVDEFHHAAAESYRRVLDHVDPAELLGLTATPERTDDLPILHWFDDRIAAELRLWEAIDQQYLSPFMYYGIHDGVDLTTVPWRRGAGYDVSALSNLYTSSDAWARLVIQQVAKLADLGSMRALGFCVSVAHARFMARHFNNHGIPSSAIWGDSPRAEREQALRDLSDGTTRVVFSVDLFNEGIDVPVVDTLLMLRPTDSATLFMQQLGRGLRKARNKGACTVLDFVGTHRKEFRFDRRYRALLGGSRQDLARSVEHGFPFLPAGCHMELDAKASEVVLQSLRSAIPTRWPSKVEELRALLRTRPAIGLKEFLEDSGLDLEDVYDGGRTWSDLLEAAGAATLPAGPHESALRKAVGRLGHIDDRERIDLYRQHLVHRFPPTMSRLAEREGRVMRMLLAGLTDTFVRSGTTLQEAAALVWAHPQVIRELLEVLDVLDERVDHVQTPIASHPECPLLIHARYTRIEILAGFGLGSGAKIAAWQSGVYEAKPANSELLAITLDKSGSGFSPTTRYRDYAISRRLIHWESQSSTRADGPTGVRYRTHASSGRSVMLFARLRASERAFWFLGPGTYRGHVGERPMAITWELEHPLSGDLFQSFAAAVA